MDNLADLLEAAVAHHRDGELDRAEPLYRQLMEALPAHPGLHHLFGVMLYQLRRFDEAIPILVKAADLDPDDPSHRVNLGSALMEAGRKEEAEEAWRQALHLQPDHADALRLLGNARRDGGDLEEALALLDRFVAASPGDARAWNDRGLARDALGAGEEAEGDFQEAVRLAPGQADYLVNLGIVRRKRGGVDEALAAFAAAIEADPGSGPAHYQRTLTLYAIGRLADAAAAAGEWCAEDPKSAHARHLAASLSGEGAPDRAAKEYVQAEFDGFAADFDAKLEKLDYRAPQLLAAALPEGELGDAADLGCGTGQLGLLLRERTRSLAGVDLSGEMLVRAGGRSVYDELYEADLVAFLAEREGEFDLLAAADTLVYFGRLDGVAKAMARSLRPGGRVAFTLEEHEAPDEDFSLLPSGRYAHSERYARKCLEDAGFRDVAVTRGALRREGDHPVPGLVVTAALGGETA